MCLDSATALCAIQVLICQSFHYPLTLVQASLEHYERQVCGLSQQKESLEQRLVAVADYPALKKQQEELEAELGLLRKQLEQAQHENRVLRTGSLHVTYFPSVIFSTMKPWKTREHFEDFLVWFVFCINLAIARIIIGSCVLSQSLV